MATELAKAYVQIVPSAEGISSGISNIMNGSDVTSASTSAGSSIGSTLVKGIGGALVAGTAVVTTAAASLWSGINATASVGDEIDKTSQKLQVTTDQYQAMAYAAEHCGFSTSVLSTAQKTLSNSDFNGNLYDAIGYIQTLGTEEERTAAAAELFGSKAAQQMQPLINGTMSIDEYSQSLSDLGGMMSSDAVSASAAFEDALTDVQTSISGAKNGIMAEFLPGCTDVMNGLAMIFSGDSGGTAIISEGITEITNSFTEVIPDIIDTITTMLPTLLTAAVQIIEAIAQGLIDALPELMPAVIDLMGQLVQDIIQMLPEILEMGMEILLELALGIAEALPDLIPTLVDVMLTIVDTLIDNIDMLVDAAIAIIIALAEGLINALPKLIEKAPEIINKLVTAFINNAPKLLAAAVELMGKILIGIKDNLPKILNAGKEIINNLVSGIKGLMSKATDIAKQVGTKIVEKVKTAFEKIKDVGGNLVKGLWNGINDKVSWITDKIKGFSKKVTDAIKGIFGIHSPSTVMRDEVGKWIPAGIAVGIEANADSVTDAMAELKTNTLDVDMLSGSINYDFEPSVSKSDNTLNQVVDLLNKHLPLIGKQQIVMDTGVLVGQTVNKMDEALGRRYQQTVRGVYA